MTSRIRCLLAAALAFAPILTAADDGMRVTVPRFTHPGGGNTFYFVLTDRFANGRTDNDTGGHPGGPDDHGFDPTRISHYHGGDFAGLAGRLDYLKGLGVTAVWLTPPLKNKPVQQGTAGYHGYWVTDFLQMDPHLGTNDEFRELVRQAHARGMKVYMDIITNHTADVIQFEGGVHTYRDRATAPYRDAAGREFDERKVAFNGYNDASRFPRLSAERSFPYRPVVPEAERTIKNPAWLNDPTVYHNRGNTTFVGENSVHGDFVGLDDLFTEDPRVVRGLGEIFQGWLESGVDGYRIDTTRHVNNEFWQAFSPGIRERARAMGKPGFLQFGEVYNDAGDPAVLSEFSTHVPIDTTLDFGFFVAARRYVSKGGTAAALADFFMRDDYYTDHDGNVHATTTFLGNHDAGRFAYFLSQDNPGASRGQLEDLVRLGHGLLFLSRGQPVVYYGDEQGMIGRGGADMQARESMFPSRAPEFRTAGLLGTSRTGADDKFDVQHPFYRFIAELAGLRRDHVALRTGAMIPRLTPDHRVFAFSRIDRAERVEYLVAFNNSRTATCSARVPTGQPPGGAFRVLFDSRGKDRAAEESLVAADGGAVEVQLKPMQFVVWQAKAPLPARAGRPVLSWVTPAKGATLSFGRREVDGLTFPTRRELRVEIEGGDGLGEVTFALRRSSRPGQWELLGVDDAPPYRVFWTPPADLPAGESFELSAAFDDLRGRTAAAVLRDVRWSPSAPDDQMGIVGTRTPAITAQPRAWRRGTDRGLSVEATGTAPLEYQWLREGAAIEGATEATLLIPAEASAGNYRVLVRNVAGTAISLPARGEE